MREHKLLHVSCSRTATGSRSTAVRDATWHTRPSSSSAFRGISLGIQPRRDGPDRSALFNSGTAASPSAATAASCAAVHSTQLNQESSAAAVGDCRTGARTGAWARSASVVVSPTSVHAIVRARARCIRFIDSALSLSLYLCIDSGGQVNVESVQTVAWRRFESTVD